MTPSLRNAFKRSGWVNEALEGSFLSFVEKVKLLNSTGRFASLIRDLRACNNADNLKSLILEASFAYKFESAKKEIVYEQCEIENNLTSVDFVRSLDDGERGCFELRLIQQQKHIKDDIEKQIENGGFYVIAQDGDDNVRELQRLQSILISKCISSDGDVIKFANQDQNICNTIVADVTDIILKAVDEYDCMQALYGKESVPHCYQLEINGLFEHKDEMVVDMPENLKAVFDKFSKIIHAVIFLKRDPQNDPFNYDLKKVLIRNTHLVDQTQFLGLGSDLDQVFGNWAAY